MKFLKIYLLGFAIVFAILTTGRTIRKIIEYRTAIKLNGMR